MWGDGDGYAGTRVHGSDCEATLSFPDEIVESDQTGQLVSGTAAGSTTPRGTGRALRQRLQAASVGNVRMTWPKPAGGDSAPRSDGSFTHHAARV